MTPARFAECLAALRWSQRGFAKRIDYDDRLVRHWAAGTRPIPADVAAWVERAAAFYGPHHAAADAWHAANPPPG